MPNHVRTVVKFKNIKNKKEMDSIMEKISTKDKNGEQTIDFSKIIPEPKSKAECPKKYIANENSGIEIRKEKPWFNWYDWNCDFWGTKWNSYDGYSFVDNNSLLFVFSTAWSPAKPIFKKLAKLGYDLEIMYADEDIGCNCGRIVYTNENEEWTEQTEDELEDSEKFALWLWNRY